MEYTLLRTIETPLGYFGPQQSLLQSPYQSTDFVNPGLGGYAKLFDVYVPINYTNPPYTSHKIVDQQGFGAFGAAGSTVGSSAEGQLHSDFLSSSTDTGIVETQTKDQSNLAREKIEDGEKLAEIDYDTEFDLKNDRKRKHLGDDVFGALMHPVIKTAKISLKTESTRAEVQTSQNANKNKPKQLPRQRPSASSKHKFKVI